MHSLFDIYEYPDIEELKTIKSLIQNLEWSDGARSNPNNPVKVNKQAYDQALSAQIHRGIYKIGSYVNKVIPRRLTPVTFNKYGVGDHYFRHNDSSLMGGEHQILTHYSHTLFLSDPDEYEGGELRIYVNAVDFIPVKLQFGQFICYPSGVRHEVMPVTEGERLGAVWWMESKVINEPVRECISSITESCSYILDKYKDEHLIMNLQEVQDRLIRNFSY